MSLSASYRALSNRAGQDGWSRIFGYPLARLLLIRLQRSSRLHPNHITVAGLAVRLAGAALFFSTERGALLAGVVALQLGQVLDSMDGTLARARGQHSAVGAFLDKVGDALSIGILAAAIGVRASAQSGNLLYLILAQAGSFLLLLRCYMHWVARGLAPGLEHERIDGGQSAPGSGAGPLREWLGGFPRLLLVGEADLYLWASVAAIAGWWREMAILLVASQALAATILVGFHLHRLARPREQV